MERRTKEIISKRKKNKKFRVRYFVFGIIIAYMIIKLMPWIFSPTNETSIVKYGNIQIVDNLNCYIIRNERLVKTNIEGNVSYFVQEGEKVEKGHKVVEIAKDIVEENTKRKFEVITQRIENLNQNKDALFQNDIQKIEYDIDEIIGEINGTKKNGNILGIIQLKNELNLKLEKKRIMYGDESFGERNLESLKKEQVQLEQKINNGIEEMISPISGIISYCIDGYENVLTPTTILSIEHDKLKKLEYNMTDLKTDKAIINQPLFKIVNNNLWYIITWIDNDNVINYKVGKNVIFNLKDEKVEGEIHKIIKNEKDTLVVFKIQQNADDFYKSRNINLDVVVVNYEGLKIYKDSIVERKDKQVGVYVLDINRHAIFKPIKIIGYDDKYAIIQSNVYYEKDGDEVKAVSTVKLYDEMVRRASKVEQGEMIY
ncbi:hypothetical protein IZY60_01580 [Lutibacter sp. B2]|nr:hypothetical protein [Lutibacter sp. B2]